MEKELNRTSLTRLALCLIGEGHRSDNSALLEPEAMIGYYVPDGPDNPLGYSGKTMELGKMLDALAAGIAQLQSQRLNAQLEVDTEELRLSYLAAAYPLTRREIQTRIVELNDRIMPAQVQYLSTLKPASAKRLKNQIVYHNFCLELNTLRAYLAGLGEGTQQALVYARIGEYDGSFRAEILIHLSGQHFWFDPTTDKLYKCVKCEPLASLGDTWHWKLLSIDEHTREGKFYAEFRDLALTVHAKRGAIPEQQVKACLASEEKPPVAEKVTSDCMDFGHDLIVFPLGEELVANPGLNYRKGRFLYDPLEDRLYQWRFSYCDSSFKWKLILNVGAYNNNILAEKYQRQHDFFVNRLKLEKPRTFEPLPKSKFHDLLVRSGPPVIGDMLVEDCDLHRVDKFFYNRTDDTLYQWRLDSSADESYWVLLKFNASEKYPELVQYLPAKS
jgi:hypothetical protein